MGTFQDLIAILGYFQNLITVLGYGLLCALIIAGASKLARPPYLSRLTDWKPSNWLSKGVSTVSSALLLVLIADEVGLFFLEWGWEWSVFLMLREFLKQPGMAQLLEAADIALVVPATYTIFSVYGPSFDEPEKEEMKKKMRVQICIILFILLVCLTFFQVFVWNTSKGVLVIALAFAAYSISEVVNIFCRYNENKEKVSERSPWKAHLFNDISLLSLALVALQTMVTKAALLLVLIPRFSKPVLRKLRTVLPIRVENPEEIDVDSLARRAHGSSTSRVIGFYFFVSCLWPALLLWQLNVSPFPPLQAGFPKTQTINLVHVVSQMLMLWALGRRKTNPLLIGAGMTAMTIAWYGLPWLAPSWYGPAVDPPGGTIFTAFLSGEEIARLPISSLTAGEGTFSETIEVLYLIPVFIIQITAFIGDVVKRLKAKLSEELKNGQTESAGSLVGSCVFTDLMSPIGMYLFMAGFMYLFCQQWVQATTTLAEMAQGSMVPEEASNALKEFPTPSWVSTVLRGVGVGGVAALSFASVQEAWFGKSEVDLKCWGQLSDVEAQRLADRRPVCAMFGSERPRSSLPNLWWLGWGFQIVIGLLLVWVATQVPKLPQL